MSSKKKKKFSDTVYHYVLMLLHPDGQKRTLKSSEGKELSEPYESYDKAGRKARRAIIKVIEALGHSEKELTWKHDFPMTETVSVDSLAIARYELWSVAKVKPNDLGHIVKDEDKMPWED